MSLMFYCLLGVTAEHAAGGTGNAEQDLGTGASLQCEGAAPPVPPAPAGPHGDSAGTPPAPGSAGAGREGLVLRSSGGWGWQWGTHCGVGRAGSTGRALGERRAQPWSSLRVDQCPGALPEAKALGTEVLGVTTCRGWKGDTGEAGTGAGPPQGAHPAWTGQDKVCQIRWANREALAQQEIPQLRGWHSQSPNAAAGPPLPQPPSHPGCLHRGLHPHPSEPRTSQQGRWGSPLQ